MLTKGVYTTGCPICHRLILMHILSDGSISQKKCAACETEFQRLDKGEEPNTFVIVPKENKKTIIVKEESEEIEKTDKKPFQTSPLTKKTGKRILKW